MIIPGFTAEVALHRTSSHYRAMGTRNRRSATLHAAYIPLQLRSLLRLRHTLFDRGVFGDVAKSECKCKSVSCGDGWTPGDCSKCTDADCKAGGACWCTCINSKTNRTKMETSTCVSVG